LASFGLAGSSCSRAAAEHDDQLGGGLGHVAARLADRLPDSFSSLIPVGIVWSHWFELANTTISSTTRSAEHDD
jgi:hypothetical protein